MKIAIVMAHYYKEMANSILAAGSTRQGLERKVEAVTEALHALHGISQNCSYATNCRDNLRPVNGRFINTVDIYVCTIGEQHILNKLPVPRNYFNKLVLDNVEPALLTFVCQMILRDLYLKNNEYDFYCYMDDDIIIRDLTFFEKLQWLNNKMANDDILIMPNCYEISQDIYDSDFKLYINHEDSDKYNVSRFQNILEHNNFVVDWHNVPVSFVKPYNPYSASYFLSNKQMKKVALEGNFTEMISFSDTLECGVMSNILNKFIIYKPCMENASFLEVEHYGDAYLKWALHNVFAAGKISTYQ